MNCIGWPVSNTTRQDIAKNLAEVTKRAVNDLERSGYRGKTVTVKIKFYDFQTQTRSKTLGTHTDSLRIIREAAFDCLSRFELKKKIRLVGVRIEGLKKGAGG